MLVFDPSSDPYKILPTGEYLIVYDNKVMGKFPSLMTAQDFQSKLGRPGSRIIAPNLRARMTETQIGTAQKMLDDWGKDDLLKRKPLP